MSEGAEKSVDLAGTPVQSVVAWEAPEFIVHAKSGLWYVYLWLGALVLAGGMVYVNGLNFAGITSASVIGLAALTLTVQGRVKPKMIRIAIDNEGVTVGGHAYLWQELTGFWIVYTEENQAVYLETNRRFLSIISLQLGKGDPEVIRTTLIARIPEHQDRAEEFTDRLTRMIKF